MVNTEIHTKLGKRLFQGFYLLGIPSRQRYASVHNKASCLFQKRFFLFQELSTKNAHLFFIIQGHPKLSHNFPAMTYSPDLSLRP